MAVQDDPQGEKPQAQSPDTQNEHAARMAGMPLSAAAAAAAAKIEATLAASRSAARNGQTQVPPVAVPAASLREPVAEPVEHQLPQKAQVVPNPAISAAAAAASTLAATAPSPASAAKTPVHPANGPAEKKSTVDAKTATENSTKDAAKSVAETEEIEDIIAMIPVDPEPQVVAAPKPSAPVAASKPEQAVAKPTPVPTPEAAPKPASELTAAVVAEARTRVFGAYSPEPVPTPAAQERRAAREAALGAKPPLARTLQVILAIIYPVLLLILAIRAVASSAFLWVVYQRPGFPADGFGFSTADRLTYGSYGVDYLNNAADQRYLGELRDPAGNPLFLNTEVQHMFDVKNVISGAYVAGIILALLMIIVLFYLGRSYAGGIRRGLFAGAVVTIGLFAGLTALAVLGWDAFFTGFHKIFFANGTWTFNYSDTLIRLYPPQFWVDAAITIGALVLIVSLITLFATWPTAKRRENSKLRQEAKIFGLK